MSMSESKSIHCKCGLLDNILADPESPIKFDHVYLEYSLQCGRTWWDLRYCPFCGEALAKSICSEFFYEVSEEERARLMALAADCKTRQQVIDKLGKPDWEFPGCTDRFMSGGKMRTQVFKQQLNYKQLSKVAELAISIAEDGETIAHISVGQKCFRESGPKE